MGLRCLFWQQECVCVCVCVCLQLARDAQAGNRHVSVAVVYDELVRKRLAERSEKNTPGFNSESNTHQPDKALLKKADKAFEDRGTELRGEQQHSSGTAWKSYSSWGGSSKGASGQGGKGKSSYNGKRNGFWSNKQQSKKGKYGNAKGGCELRRLTKHAQRD